jgi:hypothetical protein
LVCWYVVSIGMLLMCLCKAMASIYMSVYWFSMMTTGYRRRMNKSHCIAAAYIDKIVHQ